MARTRDRGPLGMRPVHDAVEPVLIRDAEVHGVVVDVGIAGGVVTTLRPPGSAPADRGTTHVVEARGGALLPGLVDHHLHLHAMAAAETSVRCGPPAVREPAALAEALRAAPARPDGWVRGIGYTESVAGDLDAAALDAWLPDRPARVQHRDGELWVLNSVGLAALGVADAEHPGIERDGSGAPTGRLWRSDDWLRDRLPDTGPPYLGRLTARLAALGITHVTDATPDLTPTALASLAGLAQHVHVLGVPLGRYAPEPLTTGPYKIVLADSGLPDVDELTATIAGAHAAGRGVAVHCVTRESLLLFLAAHEAVLRRAADATVPGAGPARAVRAPRDRIEHGVLIPAETIPELAARGLAVVSRPGFLSDRGDEYRRGLPASDLPDLYRFRTLVEAGVAVALSSDAPYGPLSPWEVIVAAAHRRTPGPYKPVLGPPERLPAGRALAAYLAPPYDPGGRPRRVELGVPADLALLDRPLHTALADPTAVTVTATLIEGRIVHGAPG